MVRWLRHQPSRAARGPLAASPACTHSLTERCAWSRCFFGSCGFMTSLSKLRATVLMALHESPACVVVSSPFMFPSPSCSGPLPAEGLRVDAIVWVLQPSALLVISFSSLPGCTSCTRFAVVTALAGAWWSVRHPRLNHAYTGRQVCVTSGAIIALPCPMLPSRWSPLANLPSRGLVVRSCLSCFLRAALVIVVASPRFPSCSPGVRRLDTICTSSHTPDTSLPSGHCTPDTALSSTNCLLATADAADLLACPRSGS